jgi:hypothetical protein
MPPPSEARAEPPRPPSPSASIQQRRADHKKYLGEREVVERSSVLRGLLLLALVVLFLAFWRAGRARAFYHGWWWQW